MKFPQSFATFVIDDDILVILALLGMNLKRHQPLGQRRLKLRSQRSLTIEDPKIFWYLKLLDFIL